MMNARIRSLTAAAEAHLPGPDQDELADLMEEFVTARTAPVEFSPEEWALLRQIDAEPFVAADPAAVAAVFARRG
jgi:predicted O-methyltransferase YrrM